MKQSPKTKKLNALKDTIENYRAYPNTDHTFFDIITCPLCICANHRCEQCVFARLKTYSDGKVLTFRGCIDYLSFRNAEKAYENKDK